MTKARVKAKIKLQPGTRSSATTVISGLAMENVPAGTNAHSSTRMINGRLGKAKAKVKVDQTHQIVEGVERHLLEKPQEELLPLVNKIVTLAEPF